MAQDLTTLRTKISNLDAGILALLDERMRLALEIGSFKEQNNLNVLDKGREEELLETLVKQNQETIIPDEKLLEIWGKILELSRDLQGGD